MAPHEGHNFKGKYPALDPDAPAKYGEVFTGYSLSTGQLGSVTSTETAMQLAEVDARLREGLKTVEASIIRPEIFEAIPSEHFKEMNRLAKIAGAEVTMHAPLIDPSGFREGRWLGEAGRQNAERQFKTIVQRSMQLNPEGNVPIVIHAAGVDVKAREWVEVPGKKVPQLEAMTVVNRETGDMQLLKREEEYFPYRKERVTKTPEDRLRTINATDWHNGLVATQDMVKEASNWIERAYKTGGKEFSDAIDRGEINRGQLSTAEQKAVQEYKQHMAFAYNYGSQAESRLADLYDKAKKYPSTAKSLKDEEKKLIAERINRVNKDWINEYKELEKLERKGEFAKAAARKNDLFLHTINNLQVLEHAPPQVYQPVEEFAREHGAKTLSNVAFDSSWDSKKKVFKKNAPLLAIENVWPDIAFSTADELKKLIVDTRKSFVKTAVKNGARESEAEKMAQKMIGATWDVGHINNLRKYGFKEEEIMKETEKISKYVKHAHIHDNFGLTDSHLPVGMGNVPLKKIMKNLKESGFDGKAVIEGGAFAAQFKGASPQPYSLQALDTPIYYPAIGGPTWGQDPGYAAHFSGYGRFLPEQHFAMYGGGFSQLPTELGGQSAARGGRFSGTPME